MKRVFIVEDELIHSEALKIEIEEAGYELAGECANADLAFDLIKKSEPDVILVDIALPGINNGITLAARINHELAIPHIFTTSFTRQEIIHQAVETNPAGYLHKPVDSTNLRAALNIALKLKGNPAEHGKVSKEENAVFAKVGDKLVRVNYNDILIIKADGENCISLVTDKKEVICRQTLKEFSKSLPFFFVQTHRGYFINLNHLDSFNEREQTAQLKGHSAPVARNYRKDFLNSIKKI
jgi:DNA-binding LytR/AlgR family response regulator